MIKKYFSKYTGQQIDEAVSALIENNVRIEDLNQEVIDLIKKGGVEIVDIPESIIEKLNGVSLTSNTPIPLTDEEFEIFNSNYETRIYRGSAYAALGMPSTVLFRFLMEVQLEDSDNSVRMFGGNSFICAQILVKEKAITLAIDPALEGSLGVSDLKYDMGQMEDRINNTETEVSNLHDTVNGVTTYVDSEIARVEGLIGNSGSTSYEKGTPVPNTGKLEKIYLNDSLTPEEVDSILDSANIEFYSTAGGYDIYELLVTNQVNNWPETEISIYRYNFDEENYGYIITTNKYTQHYPLYISPTLTDLSDVIIRDNYEKRGWMFDSSNGEDNVSNPCYILGYPHNELQATGIWSNVGLYNDAIASIVSTTPFTKQAINEINEELVQVSTKVDELTNSVNGLLDSPVAAVPASGTLENIYIRIPASDTWYVTDEKFIAACEQLDFTLGSSCVYTVARTANANIWIGGYWNSTLQKVESFYVMASSSAGERIDFEDYYGFIGVNEEIVKAGTQNDIIKEYFSVTPFEKSLPEKVDAVSTAVEELKSKSALIRYDSIINDFLLSYTTETPIQRNLTTEEIEIFSKFINNETLIGVYSYTDQGGECILYKETIATVDEPYLTFSTQLGELKYNVYITLGNTNTIYAWYQNLDMISTNTHHIVEVDKKVEELHNAISEFEEVGLHIMTQNHVLCPYIVEDIVKLATNQVSMTHRKMTTEEINFFTELKGNSTSKIAIPVEGIMIYAEKVREIDSTDLKTMNYMVLSGTESYAMSVILRSDGGEDLNNTIDIFKYTFAEKRDIDALESAIGDINSLLDQINGEVI